MTPEQGAEATLYAATAEHVAGGTYWGPSNWLGLKDDAGPAKFSNQASDPRLARQLWVDSERMTGIRYPLATEPDG